MEREKNELPVLPIQSSIFFYRFAYKDEYEKFKLVLTVILFLFSFTCRFLLSYR